jgi:hypothetical protein
VSRLLRCVLLTVLASAMLAAPALASGHESPASGSTAVAGTPFPSNRFTVPDPTQRTGLRVALPKPDCAARPSDCQDIDVLNRLDGFNLQPRLSIPFTGPIDVSSVSSADVFLVALDGRGHDRSRVVGINQVVWDPATDTLHAESDELLDQDTTVLVSNRVRVFKEGERVGRDALDTANDVRVHGKLLRPRMWRTDEDGSAVPTIRAKKVYITG